MSCSKLEGRASSSSESSPRPPQAARIAWLVGQGQYEVPGWQNGYGGRDVKKMEERLANLGYEVHVKVNAKKKDFDALPGEMVRSLGGRDDLTLLFYYAGHGRMCKGQQFLVPTDAAPTDPISWVNLYDVIALPYAVSTRSRRSREAAEACGASPAPGCRTCVFLDCCRARPPTDVEEKCANVDMTATNRVLRKTQDFVILHACEENQYAYEDEENKLGIFTSALLETLKKPGLKMEEFLRTCTKRCMDRARSVRLHQRPDTKHSITTDLVLHPALGSSKGLSRQKSPAADSGLPQKEESRDVVHEQTLDHLRLLQAEKAKYGHRWAAAIQLATEHAHRENDIGVMSCKKPAEDVDPHVWGKDTHIALHNRKKFRWLFFDDGYDGDAKPVVPSLPAPEA